MKHLISSIIVLQICMLSLHSQDYFELKKLTQSPGREGFPSWSPKGDSIVYQYSDYQDTSGMNGLWIVSQNGMGAHQIFSGVAEHPKWSPDGRYIVFDADTGQNIKILPSQGGKALSFLPDSIHIERGGLPCWSPNAEKIAFVEGTTVTLYVYNLRKGILTKIFRREGIVPLPGGWSSDGQFIYTALMEMPSRRSTILKISADGTEKKQIKGHHENFYRHLAVSPDETLMVYSALEGRFFGLYIMPAEGGASLPLTKLETGHNEGASWSPDGRKIAFNSSRSGNGDIWIMKLDIEKIKAELQKMSK
jgi:Tol biopolymer transport system component